jgi:acetylornithine deacetylase
MTSSASLRSATKRVDRALAEVDARRDELVALLGDLIRLDTTARELPETPARQERELQALISRRLAHHGATIDMWEPAPHDLPRNAQFPNDVNFDGRPQVLARMPCEGNGPSLLFCGHIDAVTPGVPESWHTPPFDPSIRDGRLYGRGAADMKGGVAAMIIAAEVVSDLGLRSHGELFVGTVTDEEFNGGGAVALAARGPRFGGAIVPEATDFEVYVCCRGWLGLTVHVPGRSGHADAPQPHWRDGGAVNAIEKAILVVHALKELEAKWRKEWEDPYLAPGVLVPTIIQGGEWWVSYPERCTVRFNINYLPGQSDAGGWGVSVKDEIVQQVAAAVADDSWLAANPPAFQWDVNLPAAGIDPESSLVECMSAAASAVGAEPQLGGQHSWDDAATLNLRGTPAITFGPSSLDPAGGRTLHATDESIAIDDLVRTTQALAAAAVLHDG